MSMSYKEIEMIVTGFAITIILHIYYRNTYIKAVYSIVEQCY